MQPLHIVFLLEEESARALIEKLAPRLLRDVDTHECIVFRGKRDLLKKLPARLRGYASWLPGSYRLVVLVDRDQQDCMELKKQLDAMAKQAGLRRFSLARPQSRQRSSKAPQIVNRIAVEELEAWYFGDLDALYAAYPRLSRTLAKKAPYREPDSISGGTWEALERVLQERGYHRGGLAKIRAAREIGPHLEPGRNRSPSFQCFQRALLGLVEHRFR